MIQALYVATSKQNYTLTLPTAYEIVYHAVGNVLGNACWAEITETNLTTIKIASFAPTGWEFKRTGYVVITFGV